MIRRIGVLLLAGALLLPSCKEEKPKVTLSAEDNAILLEKADEKIGIIIRQNLPALFAGLVAFRSDVFMTQSQMLERANISVLNLYGNAAILQLNSPDIPPLLKEKSVRKVYYLCRQGALARFDPAFEMALLRAFGEGKEAEPVSFFIRFRDPPDARDEKAVEAAGYAIESRLGYVWTVTGPLTSLYRLLENDRIIYYEGASKARTK